MLRKRTNKTLRKPVSLYASRSKPLSRPVFGEMRTTNRPSQKLSVYTSDAYINELFRLLFESAEIATFTPQERIKYEYEYDMTTERDIRNQIAFAEQKGMAEGIAEGRTQERQRIVEELRKQGIPEEVIQQAVSPSKKG